MLTIANGENVQIGTFRLNSEQQPKEIKTTANAGSYANDRISACASEAGAKELTSSPAVAASA